MSDLYTILTRHLGLQIAAQERARTVRHPPATASPIQEDSQSVAPRAPERLNDMGFSAMRPWPNGHWIALEPMTFGRVRLGISATAAETAERAFAHGYADVWEFPTPAVAHAQFETWDGDGEPVGWSRHPMTCRRRQDDGAVLVRVRELPAALIAELRAAVSGGATHECNEWWGEPYSVAAGRCVLCDRLRSGATPRPRH